MGRCSSKFLLLDINGNIKMVDTYIINNAFFKILYWVATFESYTFEGCTSLVPKDSLPPGRYLST